MNKTTNIEINAQNAASIAAEIAGHNTLFEIMSLAAYSYEGQEDNEALGWHAAACYAMNTMKVLGQHCLKAIEDKELRLASLLYVLMQKQFQFMESARSEERSGISLKEMYESKIDFAATLAKHEQFQMLVQQLKETYGADSQADAFEKGVFDAFQAVVHESASSVLYGADRPEQYFTDTVLANIAEDLIAQIMASGVDRQLAEQMLCQTLGADNESRRKFLVEDIRVRNRLDSENVRMGIMLTGNLEHWIAGELLKSLPGQSV